MNRWIGIVREYYAWRTPAPPPLEEAMARMNAAKPFFIEEQREALRGIEDENFGPACGSSRRRWWQRWL